MRLLLVDSFASIRQPLAFMLDQQPDLEIAGDVGSPAEALRVAAAEDVDLVLIDIELTEGDGVDLIRALRMAHPNLKVLVLTGTADHCRHAYAIEAGAAAVLHRSVAYDEVLTAIRQLGTGQRLMSADEAVAMRKLALEARRRERVVQQAIKSLTRREQEVLKVMSEGLNDPQIAKRLHIGTDTVRKHVVHVRTKLGVKSKLKAVLFAVRYGVVKIDDSMSAG